MTALAKSLRVTVAFAAAVLILGAGEPVQRTWEIPAGVQTVTINGYPMAYAEAGSGPALILVHGAASDYRSWKAELASLSPRFRVIALSLRHYYPERWNGSGQDFSEEQHARDVVAFIDRLGGGPVHLVGHSRGAHVAIFAARSRPALIRKLVLMEPALTALDSGYKRDDDPRVVRWHKTAKLFEAHGIDRGLEFFIDDISGPGFWQRLSDDRRQRLRDNAWTIPRQLDDTASISCADVGSLKMPVLLVVGQKTTRQFIDIIDATQKCLPSAERVMIPDAGHAMQLDNPAAFDAALIRFLSD
jgi:pimeloyl-ACP methyl ester carboxylesterase